MRIPWRLKIAAKLVLARLPVDYRAWKRLGLFEHGAMDDPAYAEAVFARHFARSGLAGRNGFTCLEIGPGDSLASALIAKAHGAANCWLVDSGDFAMRDMAYYREVAQRLAARGLAAPPADALASPDAMLAWCNARYLTEGVATLRRIPAGSIDLIWSQAVLEHIRRRDFAALVAEMHRILRPGGVASHRIDLQDHLGGALNNLRFAERVWEADWFARSGFYTNRLRHGEMLDAFRAAGFDVETSDVDGWETLPTPRAHLAAPFAAFSDEELRIAGFDVVLRRRTASA